jgi:polyhydroxyalkanoate synthesis repressor PhaR
VALLLLPFLTRRVIFRGVSPETFRFCSIRRYENRKLYDAEAGRYVIFEDVGRMVVGGGEVEVVDQKTGEDLTSFTLAQVLLERVRTGASRIPRQVLTRLIRIATGPSSAWGDWPEPQDAAGRARQEAERIVSRVLGRGRLSLDEAVALRQDLGQMVHRLVAEAQAGVESRFRSLLERAKSRALAGAARRARGLRDVHRQAPAATRLDTRRGRRPAGTAKSEEGKNDQERTKRK